MDLIIDNSLYKNIICNLSFDEYEVEIFMPNSNFWRLFKDGNKYYMLDIFYKYKSGDIVKYGVIKEATLNHISQWKMVLNFKKLDEDQKYISKFRCLKLMKVSKTLNS